MRVLETVLYAENLEEAARFYREVLGLKQIAKEAGKHAVFQAENVILQVFKPSSSSETPPEGAHLPLPPHGASGAGHLCFELAADDFEYWIEVLLLEDIEIDADFEWPQGGRSLYFRDPAGNSLEFAERRIWDS